MSNQRNQYLECLRKKIPGKAPVTQNLAAMMLEVDQRTYRRWELGEMEPPKSAVIVMELASRGLLPESYLPWA